MWMRVPDAETVTHTHTHTQTAFNTIALTGSQRLIREHQRRREKDDEKQKLIFPFCQMKSHISSPARLLLLLWSVYSTNWSGATHLETIAVRVATRFEWIDIERRPDQQFRIWNGIRRRGERWRRRELMEKIENNYKFCIEYICAWRISHKNVYA